MVEKSRKLSKAFFFGKDVMVWLAKVDEECSKFLGNWAPYQKKRDGNRVLLIQRCQNSYDKFIKLVELGTGNGKGIIAILEGKNEQRKARLVVKEFHQQEGIDCFETLYPIIKPVTIRLIIH